MSIELKTQHKRTGPEANTNTYYLTNANEFN